jgi:hypothetical protein
MVMHLIQQQQQPSILFPSKLDRLEMKPHEPKKNRYKTWAKNKEKTKGDKKNPNKKRRKDNKTLSQKSEKRLGKKLDKSQ